ncbi:uncharacterized protein coro1cb isoform X1 [Festucalex cinctus]
MTGLSMNWFLLWGLSGGFSILVSGDLVVPTTVEMQTRLSTIFEDSPERLQTSGSSPSLVPKRDSSPFPIQDHSSTERSDPTFKSITRSLISTPAEPPEPSKNSFQSTLVPIQSQKTHGETSSTGVSDRSSLTSTSDPQEAPRTSSIPWSKGNSTPIQKDNSSPGFGTTDRSTTSSLKHLNLSTTKIPISSPEPLKPSSSSSVPESTTVPIQDHNILSGFGTTGNTSLTSNANRNSYISTADPPRTRIQSTLVPIQSHKTPAMTSLTSTFNPTSLISKPAEPTRTSSTTKSTLFLIPSHSSPPDLGTTQKTSLTSNTDLTRLTSTPEPPRSPPVTIQSSPPDLEPTVRTDADLTTQDFSATRSLSSSSQSSSATRTSSIAAAARTPAPCATSKTRPTSADQPCSSRGVVRPCLVAIACLAALATAFMVSTIVLCAKLSTRKYKLRKSQDQTEMTFMSALLPERNYAGVRRQRQQQRSPVSNGVLVIHSAGDSDEDISDNLTLSSFLPESDRCV